MSPSKHVSLFQQHDESLFSITVSKLMDLKKKNMDDKFIIGLSKVCKHFPPLVDRWGYMFLQLMTCLFHSSGHVLHEKSEHVIGFRLFVSRLSHVILIILWGSLIYIRTALKLKVSSHAVIDVNPKVWCKGLLCAWCVCLCLCALRFVNAVFFLLPKLHGILKTHCLECVASRAEVIPDIYMHLKTKDFTQIMSHRYTSINMLLVTMARENTVNKCMKCYLIEYLC